MAGQFANLPHPGAPGGRRGRAGSVQTRSPLPCGSVRPCSSCSLVELVAKRKCQFFHTPDCRRGGKGRVRKRLKHGMITAPETNTSARGYNLAHTEGGGGHPQRHIAKVSRAKTITICVTVNTLGRPVFSEILGTLPPRSKWKATIWRGHESPSPPSASCLSPACALLETRKMQTRSAH